MEQQNKTNAPISLESLGQTLYEEMKKRGVGMMKDERREHTLSPTALVHEAVERLLDSDQRLFNNRSHMLAAAALAMRRILVEHARARGRLKRGGGLGRSDWDVVVQSIGDQSDPDALLDLDDAIEHLRKESTNDAERVARLAELRLFGSMRADEIAHVLGVSVSTVEKDWRYAKAQLRAFLARDGAR